MRWNRSSLIFIPFTSVLILLASIVLLSVLGSIFQAIALARYRYALCMV
jgi:hypothetical protein